MPGRGSSSSASPNPYRREMAARMGATRRRRPARARPRRRAAGAGHGRGLRRRPRDVRQPGGDPRGISTTWPTAATSRSSASRPRRSRSTSTTIIFKMLTIRGIYGREMYETWYKMTVMLQSGLDITPGDHRPVRVPRPRGRVRGGALGRLGQGHPRLGPEGRARGGQRHDRDTPATRSPSWTTSSRRCASATSTGRCA